MKKLLSITFLIALSFIISINLSLASTEDSPKTPSGANTVSLTNPLTGTKSSDSIPVLLGKIISYAMGIIGSLALVMIIYGGLTWMLSAGNDEKVKQGKQIVIWSVAGIGLIFLSYVIVRFVIMAISGATSP